MEKRLFIAVLISIAFLLGWSVIMPKLFPELAKSKKPPATRTASEKKPARPVPSAPTSTAAEKPPTKPEPVAAPAAPAAVTPISADHEQEVVIDNPRYIARFTNRGAELVSFQLKNYPDLQRHKPVELVKPRPAGRTDFPFAIHSSDAKAEKELNGALFVIQKSANAKEETVTFTYRSADGKALEKKFEFPRDQIAFSYAVHAAGVKNYSLIIGPGIGHHDTKEESRFLVTGDAILSLDGSFKVHHRAKVEKVESFDQVDYIGLADNYFITVLIPAHPSEGDLRPIKLPSANPKKPETEIFAGIRASHGDVRGRAYFGPKKADLLEEYGLEAALQFGIFGFIARYLLIALVWVNRFTNNFGWAIIVLTVIIKVILFPLQHKSIVSMKKMQTVQPKVNAIRDKYKKAKSNPEQRQQMNTEMMKLYQKEGINPMSGCFPMLLQLPILWAFYVLLAHAIELRGAPWIWWIHDLSLKDPYYVTPIVMTITMFVQQWMTPTTADPTQRKLFMIMPIVFGWIFKEFPSGLVLYWLVQNLLTIIQQGIMNRWWQEHPEQLEQGAA